MNSPWLATWLSGIALWACLSGAAIAAQVTLNPVADATLIEDPAGALANGAAANIYVGRTGINAGETLRRGLLRFDLSAIPPGSTILGATLTLRLERTRVATYPIALHRVNGSWGEGTSSQFGGGGTAATPGDATWRYRFFGSAQTWGTPGGDFAPTASATTTVGFDETDYAWTTSQLAADLQSWLDAPAGNFGWILVPGGSATSAKAFASRENPTAFLRPRLTVTYAVSTTPADAEVPLPAWALTLLAIGCGATLARRRR